MKKKNGIFGEDSRTLFTGGPPTRSTVVEGTSDVAMGYFIHHYRAMINRRALNEYRLLSAAAVAPLGYADDAFDTDSFIELAASFPIQQ